MSLDVWLTDKPQTRYTTGGIVRCLWRQGRVLLTRSPYLSKVHTAHDFVFCSRAGVAHIAQEFKPYA